MALSCLALTVLTTVTVSAREPIALGGRRELFVDRFLIDRLVGTELRLHAPRDEGVAFAFDKPWEGLFSGYASIVTLDDGRLRAYYRGKAVANKDGSAEEITCIAESKDGRTWTNRNWAFSTSTARAPTTSCWPTPRPSRTTSRRFVTSAPMYVQTNVSRPCGERWKAAGCSPGYPRTVCAGRSLRTSR